jgi:fructose-bisphosphate aldolase class II
VLEGDIFIARVTLRELLEDAENGGYGIPAYSTIGGHLGVLRTVLRTAEDLRSPVIIIKVYTDMTYYSDPRWYAEAATTAIKTTKILAALHLDHTFCFEHIVLAIRYGFTSVMFYWSRLPYEENSRITEKVFEMSHAVGLTVEGMLGNVGGLEGDMYAQKDTTLYNDPHQAATFVEETGIEALAPAIGTCNGLYTEEPELYFSRLKKIKDLQDMIEKVFNARKKPLGDFMREQFEAFSCAGRA